MSTPGPTYYVQDAEISLNKAKTEIRRLEERLKEEEGWRQHIQNIRGENASLHTEIEALKKGIERLKQKPVNFTFSSLLDAYKTVKKEYRDLQSHIQFEKDNTLHAIREVLGARNRTDDRPHETALNAAKRIMLELEQHKRRADDHFDIIKDAKKALNLREIDCLVKGASDIKAKLEDMKTGAKTSPPPAGHLLVKQERYDELIRKEYNGENIMVHRDFYAKLVKDSEDLADIKEKLGIDSPGA